MYCENCGNNEANVKYTQIINGVKKQMNLCEHCANKMGINNFSFSMPMSLFNFMEDMFEPQMVMPKSIFDDVFENEFDTFSPKITIDTGKINNSGDEMDELLKKINKNRTINKNNKKETEKNKTENKKIELQKKLEKEIKEERYEDAAKTRDEIKKIEG